MQYGVFESYDPAEIQAGQPASLEGFREVEKKAEQYRFRYHNRIASNKREDDRFRPLRIDKSTRDTLSIEYGDLNLISKFKKSGPIEWVEQSGDDQTETTPRGVGVPIVGAVAGSAAAAWKFASENRTGDRRQITKDGMTAVALGGTGGAVAEKVSMRVVKPGIVLALGIDDGVATDRSDIVEVNHYYSQEGIHVFDQIIFWDWCEKDCEFRCYAWRLIKNSCMAPKRDWERGGYVTEWQDGRELRQVRSTTSIESWTQFDPEMHDREFFPREKRRGLFGRRKFTSPAIAPAQAPPDLPGN